MSTTYGDLATVLRLIVANQRRLTDMLRRTDPHVFAWRKAYDDIFADLAAAEDLLDRGRSIAAPEVTIPDPAADGSGIRRGHKERTSTWTLRQKADSGPSSSSSS